MAKSNAAPNVSGVERSKWAKEIPAGRGPFRSMADVKAHHQGYWFSPNTLTFFRSRVSDVLYAGRFFVTSERHVSPYSDPDPRLYTVRVAMNDGDIETMGDFQQYATRELAHAAAIRYADELEAGHTLTTDGLHSEECEGPGCERPEPNDRQLDSFTYGYAYCLIWTGYGVDPKGDEGETVPLHPAEWQSPGPGWELEAFSDTDGVNGRESSYLRVRTDAENFLTANLSDLRAQALARGGDDSDLYREGSDFALTRNGHGAGFWDRGTGEIGDRLTREAKTWGECNAWAWHGEEDTVPDLDVHVD